MSSAFWDERYSQPGFAYGTEPNAFLAEVEAGLPRGAALLPGDGEGRNSVWLAERGFDVTAVDQSGAGMRKAAALANERGVSLHTITAELEDFDIGEDRWSVIALIWVHLPPPLRERVHRACVRGLRKDGALVLEAYRPEQLQLATGGPRDAAMFMTLPSLRNDLAGLYLTIAEDVTREVHEGTAHHGPSACVRVLGFKRG